MSLLLIQTRSPGKVRAKTFFEHVCPILFGQRAGLCRDLGGRYSFQLSGDGGGSWTLDFLALTVEPGAREADLAVSMRAIDFESLMDGSLDTGVAIQRGDLAFTGDGDLFENLAVFTQPSRTKKTQTRVDGGDDHAC